METNTNRGLKRRADEEEMANEASTSKTSQVINTVVGVAVTAHGNAKVSIANTNVHQHIHQHIQRQPTPEHPPCGIELEVADPVTSFCGRVEQLQHIKNAFNSPRNKKPYNLVAVCGYGGIGKTELARKFVQQNRVEFENTIWINAEFKGTINDSFSKLQSKLKHNEYRCASHYDVYNHLNSDKSIFVFDNAENMQSIRSFLPQKSNDCFFLITSQYKTWSPYTSITLDKLDLDSATNVMKVILETHEIEISESQLETLVDKIERIPLVLQIVAGFVCQEILELKSIGAKYNIDNVIQELDTDSELVTQEFPAFSQDSYTKSVFEALSRTLDKIWAKPDKVSKLAINMLGISSYLSSDRIKERVLKKITKVEDENLFNKSLANLVQFSLFKISNHHNIDIHRTVQECVRYYCVNKLNSSEYYLQALQILLNSGFEYSSHHKVILQHGESYLDTFYTFYDGNKCRTLNRNLGYSISCQLLKHVLDKFSLIKNPEFICEVVVTERHDIKQLLLDQGADFNVIDDQGFNALYYACLSGVEDCVTLYNWDGIQTLINSGADVNSLNLEGNTVIHSLCNLGKMCTEKDGIIFGMCALLIKVGGDPKIKNNAGQTPADLAQECGLTWTRQLIDTAISGYLYIWHITAECRQFIFLENFIREGVCNINEQDDSGRTIFHVLAGLAQLDAEDEVKLLYNTAALLKFNHVIVVNNAGETAADVARRNGREKLVDLLNAKDQLGRIILHNTALRSKLNHFQYVHSSNKKYVNEQDDTGCTLLHTLCVLDTHGDTELELDIIKFAAELVILQNADVRIINNAGDTAADVSRRHGRLLLADFLDFALDCIWNINLVSKLVCFSVKHKQFSVIKYAWWRFCYLESQEYIHEFPILVGSEILRVISCYEEPTVTDADLIRVCNDLDLKLVAKYEPNEYYLIVGITKQYGRDELAAWLKTSICDINKRDDLGCTLLHELSDDYARHRGNYEKKYEFNRIVNLVVYCDADVSVVNNAGETAAVVARRHGEEKLADFLNAWEPPTRTIYQTDAHRSKLQHFPFVSNNNVQDVNYQDDTGSTLLHALCGLVTRDDSELELNIVKLAAHLVIRCDADVRIMNNTGATAADVARRHGRLLLADFLDPSMDPTALNLISISAKLKQFGLVKHVWWRYLYTMPHRNIYTSADQAGCSVLRKLCEIEDLTVTDAELIKLMDYLYLDLKLVTEFSNDFYNKVVATARGNQRPELVAWLEKGGPSDSDDSEDYSEIDIEDLKDNEDDWP